MIDWEKDLFFKPRWGFAWYPAYDKVGHFLYHYFAMFGLLCWFLRLDSIVTFKGMCILAWLLLASLGIAYEFLWEWRKNRKPSWKDIVANEVGHLIGVVCIAIAP